MILIMYINKGMILKITEYNWEKQAKKKLRREAELSKKSFTLFITCSFRKKLVPSEGLEPPRSRIRF